MTRALKRTQFHSSGLMRTLADLAVLETDRPVGAFAEKLGQWIDFADAIALCAVHNGATATPTREPSTVHSDCLLYTSPSPRDRQKSRMPSSA